MRILKTWEQAHNEIHKGMVLALGNFDGLHLGHQALLANALKIKDHENVLALLIFNPHPQFILKGQGPLRITTTPELITVLEPWAVDYLLQMPFTTEVAHLSAEAFVQHITKHLTVKTIVVGYNYRFGCQASGDTTTLTKLGRQYGFEVIVVPAVKMPDQQSVSSTAIRQHLLNGNLLQANARLGRPFLVQGTVIKGFQRGHQLGFPTANLRLSKEKILPPAGVYAGKVQAHKAVINLGYNPTFSNTEKSLEVHILDYPDIELYGQTLQVEFQQYLRPEQKFCNITALKQQISQDIACVRTMKY